MLFVNDGSAAYAEDSGAFALNVRDTGNRPADHYGKRQWSWSIHKNGALLTEGADIYGHGDAREALGTLVAFLTADAERYQRHMGPVPDGDDPYAFGDVVAEWAYMVDSELSLADMEIRPEEYAD